MGDPTLDPAEGETLDAMGEGRVRVLQRRDGYRFNLDAVMLAGFAIEGLETERSFNFLELGAGSGVVSLLVKSWRPWWRVSALERQEGLAALADRSVRLNGLEVRIDRGDWRELVRPPEADRVDVVACNPPYFEADAGRVPADPEVAGARVALHGGVAEMAAAARRVGTDRVRLRVVYPAGRLPALLEAVGAAKLVASRLRPVCAKAGEAAHLVLLEARAGWKGPLAVEAPLVVHGEDARFGPEVRRLISREGPAGAPPA